MLLIKLKAFLGVMTAVPILILISFHLLHHQHLGVVSGETKLRQKELAAVLSPLLTPGVETEDYQTGDGWCQPTNREAVVRFIKKYPNTEEAYEAQIWLIYGQHLAEQKEYPPAEKARLIELCKELDELGLETQLPGYKKITKVESTFLQVDTGNYNAFKKQAYEIINHIDEYNREKSPEYLRFYRLSDSDPSDLEPTLREAFIRMAMYQHRKDEALAYAEDLKLRFPFWEQQSVNSYIELLKMRQLPWEH